MIIETVHVLADSLVFLDMFLTQAIVQAVHGYYLFTSLGQTLIRFN